jgi:hypothetical protein
MTEHREPLVGASPEIIPEAGTRTELIFLKLVRAEDGVSEVIDRCGNIGFLKGELEQVNPGDIFSVQAKRSGGSWFESVQIVENRGSGITKEPARSRRRR